MRGSHERHFELTDRSAAFADRLIRKYVQDHEADVFAPALRKGDAIFWSATVIHGSLPTVDPAFSRKSLTAHYMPARLRLGNMFGEARVQPTHVPFGELGYRRVRRNPISAKVRDRWPQLWNEPALRRGWRGLLGFGTP